MNVLRAARSDKANFFPIVGFCPEPFLMQRS
jgi:hypothetical protein